MVTLVTIIYSAISRYTAAITGTSISEMVATRFIPPKIIGAEIMTNNSATTCLPVPHEAQVLSPVQPTADCTAWAMVLA